MLPRRTFSGKLAEPTVIDWPSPLTAPPPPSVPAVVVAVPAAVVAAAAPVSLLESLSESEPHAARSINDALAPARVSFSCLLMGEPPGSVKAEAFHTLRRRTRISPNPYRRAGDRGDVAGGRARHGGPPHRGAGTDAARRGDPLQQREQPLDDEG